MEALQRTFVNSSSPPGPPSKPPTTKDWADWRTTIQELRKLLPTDDVLRQTLETEYGFVAK